MSEVAEEPNSLMSESSFVILGKGSLPTEPNSYVSSGSNSPLSSYIHQNGVISPKDSVVANSVHDEGLAVNEGSYHGIQMKLDHLVKENLLLKETLNQSNLAMKSQFDKLVLWHEDVVKTHESHKQKFQETQEQISKLRQENAKLQKMVGKDVDEPPRQEGVFLSAVEVASVVSNNSLEQKLELAQDHLKKFIKENEELVLKNEQLEKSLSTLFEEKLSAEKSLKDVVEELNLLKASISLRSTAGSDKVIQCDGEKSLPYGDKSIDPEMSLLSSHFGDSTDVPKLKEEISNLKKQLEEQKMISQKNCEQMGVMKSHCETTWKENATLKNDLKNFQSLVDSLSQKVAESAEQLKKKEDLLESMSRELEESTKEMQKFNLGCEEVAILREQVKLYESDFNEERRAREKAVEEKENMAERVRFLERQYKEMEKNSSNKEQEEPKKEEQREYKCPLCLLRFTDINNLERHASDCVESI